MKPEKHESARTHEQDALGRAFVKRILEQAPHVLDAQEERQSDAAEAIWLKIRPALTRAWKCMMDGADGAWYVNKRQGLKVIMSVSEENDGKLWAHVSCSRKGRVPDYRDLCSVKNLFLGPERKALHIFPPRSEHVNIHPTCLHLWCCLEDDGLPDFTAGTGSI